MSEINPDPDPEVASSQGMEEQPVQHVIDWMGDRNSMPLNLTENIVLPWNLISKAQANDESFKNQEKDLVPNSEEEEGLEKPTPKKSKISLNPKYGRSVFIRIWLKNDKIKDFS